MSRWLLHACIVSALATASLAEVRIEQSASGPDLAIQAVARGVWSPGPRSDASDLLNPGGDVLGDGFPSHVRGNGKLLVAWHRPSSGSIALAEVQGSGLRTMEIADASPSGSLVPLQTPWGWMVLWQERGDAPGVFAAIIQDGVVGPPIVLEGTVLLGAFSLQNDVVVVTGDLDRDLVIVSRTPMTPIPVPIGYIAMQLTGAQSEVPTICVSSPTSATATVVVRPVRGEAAAILVDEFGMSSPVWFRPSRGSCNAVLKAAER